MKGNPSLLIEAALLLGVLCFSFFPEFSVAQFGPAKPSLNSKSLPGIENAPLPAEDAFKFVASNKNGVLTITGLIAEGHYLYQQSLAVIDSNGQKLPIKLSTATKITDEYFGDTEVYFDLLDLVLDIKILGEPQTQHSRELTLLYQGCAKDRYCYPPLEHNFLLP